MGVVYHARQQQPIRREVAIKLIRSGYESQAIVRRFESERQALALMSHPNIAGVLDAGTTSDGRPYFVMDYVPGIPITDYCNEHGLGVEQRLELFVRVFEGV